MKLHCLFVFIDGLLEKLHCYRLSVSVAGLSINVATLSYSVPRLSISVARLSISVATLSYSVPRLSISVARLSISVATLSISVH